MVADLTGGNPNVFYELAIRHAVRKPVVSIADRAESMPFDVYQSRTILFDVKDLDSVRECKEGLERQIRSLEEDPTDFFTPVSAAIDLMAMSESGEPTTDFNAQLLNILVGIQADVMSQLFEARAKGHMTDEVLGR